MYCSNCGEKALGTFCHLCGAKIQGPTESALIAITDWREETRYQSLLNYESVRRRIEASAALAKKKWNADDFLGLADKVYKPMTGVSLKTLCSIAQPLYAKLGIKKTKAVEKSFGKPVGEVIVASLCSLAKNGQPLKQVQDAVDGCVIEADVPSDLWAMIGSLVVTVHKREQGAAVEAVVTFPGQWYAWGKEHTVLNEFFEDLDFRSEGFRKAA